MLPEITKEQRDMWTEVQWFAVQAKTHREDLAAASVFNLSVEVFLPKMKEERLVCGVERMVVKPLFTGYFFARFAPSALLDSVRYARGVLRVVGSGPSPIPVDEEIIAAIRGRLHPDGFVKLAPLTFRAGDQVMVEQGSLSGWVGRVEREWDDGKRVMILLETILRPRLLVNKRWLTLVADAA